MITLVSDENFDDDILRGVVRRLPELDVVRVHECGLAETPDPVILQWAAEQDRIVLTHDRRTLLGFAYQRVRLGQPMPGVFLVSDNMAKGHAIEELVLALQCLFPDECRDHVTYFPL